MNDDATSVSSVAGKSRSDSRNKPDDSANLPPAPPLPPPIFSAIAILVTAESAASVVYGMFDLLKCAGRDWPMVVSGEPGPALLDPVLVSRAAPAS